MNVINYFKQISNYSIKYFINYLNYISIKQKLEITFYNNNVTINL